MCIKLNGIETEYPNTAKEVEKSFYFDDYLGGVNSLQEATKLKTEMHDLFLRLVS